MKAPLSFPAHDSARLTGKQLRAVEALVERATLAAAAKKAGVNAATLYRWRTDDDAFRAALRAARDAAFGEALDGLRASTSEASRTLAILLKPARARQANQRLVAARAILTLALKANEALIVDERLRAVESRLGIR